MGGVLRFALEHLRGAWQRTVAAGVAIFVAVTSFVLLTSTVTAQELQVTKTVQSNYRSTYDILVRPHGDTTAQERRDGSVRAGFLAGEYGGITLAQVRRIAEVPGVAVAAPVAVLGQVMRTVLLPIDVSSVLAGRDRAMVRFGLQGTARNGSAHTTNQNGYLYLTREPLDDLDSAANPTASSPGRTERRDGRTITACLASNAGGKAASPTTAFQEQCSTVAEGDSPRVEVLFSLPLTVEAIDPTAEERLTRLHAAVVSGRSLRSGDSAGLDTTGPAPVEAADAVLASTLPLDYQATVTVDRLSDQTMDAVLAARTAAQRRALVLDAKSDGLVASITKDAGAVYRQSIVAAAGAGSNQPDQTLFVQRILQPGAVAYSGNATLTPTAVVFDADAWRDSSGDGTFISAPSSIADTGYRAVRSVPLTDTSKLLTFRVVGTYDPDKIPRPSKLNQVPLETYRSAVVTGADATSRRVLGDRPLRSDLDPAGYLQSPPALLIPLKALPVFEHAFRALNRAAPVSSVRIRVAGVHGLGPVARERIRQVAARIESETGLDVDITIGASLQNHRVDLPRSAAGTPALRLDEQWTKKGVAVAITQAIDVKSLTLFLLILVSSALTVALIATATVAARRRELATLACIGWPTTRIGGLLATELALLGIASGALGALAAWPLAGLLHVETSWWQIALAVPLGAVLALLPGLAGALSASRVSPIEAFRPRAARVRTAGGVGLTGPVTLGLLMLAARPGRALLGLLAVALPSACAVLLLTIVRAFDGAVVGSFLGNAVALQVRTPDIVATVILAALALTTVVTVVTLAVLEDAPQYAALQAIGWRDARLNRSLVTQAGSIGLAGALVGTVAATIAAAALLGPIEPDTVLIGAGTVPATTAVCAITALVPAAVLRRLPMAQILARE